MFGKLVAKFLPAARVLVLELHARGSERIALSRAHHAGLLEFLRGRFGFLREYSALVGRGAIAAAGNPQRPRAFRIGKAEMQGCEAAHREPDNVSLVELEPIEHGEDVVARAILEIALHTGGYTGTRGC